MNWKGLLGGVAVGVGTTLKDRADAAQKERLQELAYAKEQVIRQQDQAFRATEAEKGRTFEATQGEAKSKRDFENERSLLEQKNQYEQPALAADIEAKRANAEESRARAKYYGEGGGSPGGRVSTPAAIQKADAMVEAARMSNPNLTPEEEANIRMIALGGAPSARDDAKSIDGLFRIYTKENPRIDADRRFNELSAEEKANYVRNVSGQLTGRKTTPSQATTTATTQGADGGDWVRDANGKWVRK